MVRILVLLFSLKFVSICSQTSYYIEPVINTKASFSSTSQFRYTDFIGQFDNRFSIENQSIIYPYKFSPIQLGINIGLISANKKNIFELGLNMDESNAGIEFGLNGINSEGDPSYYYGSHHAGRTFGNLHLNYKYKMNGDKKQFNWYFIGGIGLGIRGKPTTYIFNTYDFSASIDSNTNFYLESTNTRTASRAILLYNVGFQLDVNMPNGKYLFSSSLYYTYSTKVMTALYTNVEILGNMENKNYSYTSYGRGSGLYFQLSRRIKMPPRKIKK